MWHQDCVTCHRGSRCNRARVRARARVRLLLKNRTRARTRARARLGRWQPDKY